MREISTFLKRPSQVVINHYFYSTLVDKILLNHRKWNHAENLKKIYFHLVSCICTSITYFNPRPALARSRNIL